MGSTSSSLSSSASASSVAYQFYGRGDLEKGIDYMINKLKGSTYQPLKKAKIISSSKSFGTEHYTVVIEAVGIKAAVGSSNEGVDVSLNGVPQGTVIYQKEIDGTLQRVVDFLRNVRGNYDLLTNNCQHFAKKLYHYL